MLTEQSIGFELRVPGPLAVHELLQLVVFMTKQKLPRNIFEWIILLFTSKILQEAMYLTSPTWAKSLAKFNTKMQDVKRVLDLNC